MTLDIALAPAQDTPQLGPVTLALAEVRRESDLQPRANGTSKAAAREYSEAMKAGAVFPPVVVFRDSKGVLWLADGFTRCAAIELLGLPEVLADVREGSKKDALLFAASANANHGLRRTTADKRRAVSMLLADPTWQKRSNEWLAKHAAVSAPFVAKMKGTLNVLGDGVRETSDGRVMDTAGLGRTAPEQTIAERLQSRIESLITQWPENDHATLSRLLIAWGNALAPATAAAE